MEAKAIAKHIRIAPRKIRIVADLVRGKNVGVLAPNETRYKRAADG